MVSFFELPAAERRRFRRSLTRIVKVQGIPPIFSTIEKARAAATGA